MTPTRVHLLEVEPDLAAFLSPDEEAVARRLTAPVVELPAGPFSFDELGSEADSFAALVSGGIVLNRLGTGEHRALRLLGAGDVLTLSGPGHISWLESSWEAAAAVVLVMLDDHFLAATRQLPRLTTGLQVRVAEQIERVAAQMLVCQLPRVADRVLALLWLLAESWGRVTGSGTIVPIALTHDTVGELIGARRPTVTLAVTELHDRGALIRNDGGWLLLERPPDAVPNGRVAAPELIAAERSAWGLVEQPRAVPVIDHQRRLATVLALREQHLESAERFRDGLERAALVRERSRKLRSRIGATRLSSERRREARRRAIS